MRRTSTKPKRNIFAGDGGYDTYDSRTEGFGDSSQWKAAFNSTMNIVEAIFHVGKDKPLDILGVVFELNWTREQEWKAIRFAWVKLIQKTYPEMRADGYHGDNERFLKVQGAFTILKRRYGKE